MIHYFCPNTTLPSSGVRLLHNHVETLNRHGRPAAILYPEPGFRLAEMPAVPVGYLSVPETLNAGDIVVIPEGCTQLLARLSGLPLTLVVICLNWKYIYSTSQGLYHDWRKFSVKHAIVNSPVIADLVEWAMQIPTHLITMGIDPALYHYDPGQKQTQISFIARKGEDARELQCLLGSRNPAYVEAIAWKPLYDLSQADYARDICHSQLFLNVSPAEGFPFSLVEAMRAGTLVAGYNSVGGQHELVGDGPHQNCILSENLDYITLARRLEPVLDDMLRVDLIRWNGIIQNAIEFSRAFTPEREAQTCCSAWDEILAAM